MFITLTPNPSVDATLTVDAIARGEVARATEVRREAGGKGINVAHVASAAGFDTLALAPSDESFAAMVHSADVAFQRIPTPNPVRTNTAIVEADGTTTKINERGPLLDDATRTATESSLADAVTRADAVVLAGSLPPGAPEDWYAKLVKLVRDHAPTGTLIAVDTSDTPLIQLGEHLPEGAPDVIKPNAFELAQLVGGDGAALEAKASAGEIADVIAAARALVNRGIPEVLVTLGGSGACLVTAAGAWTASPPPITVRSTVGAGDSSLAGYIMARLAGLAPAECLRRAVAYGSAAAALPGTGLPTPSDLDLTNTHVSTYEETPEP